MRDVDVPMGRGLGSGTFLVTRLAELGRVVGPHTFVADHAPTFRVRRDSGSRHPLAVERGPKGSTVGTPKPCPKLLFEQGLAVDGEMPRLGVTRQFQELELSERGFGVLKLPDAVLSDLPMDCLSHGQPGPSLGPLESARPSWPGTWERPTLE